MKQWGRNKEEEKIPFKKTKFKFFMDGIVLLFFELGFSVLLLSKQSYTGHLN